MNPKNFEKFVIESMKNALRSDNLLGFDFWCSHDVSREYTFNEAEYGLGLLRTQSFQAVRLKIKHKSIKTCIRLRISPMDSREKFCYNDFMKTSAYQQLKNAYFSGDLSVSYTLRSDDITKGEKPQGTPYVSREDKFDENGFAKETQSCISVCKRGGGYYITLVTHVQSVSEYGLNLPFNFMGKKNLGGWRNQYLFNSPYSSDDNRQIFCYLTNPNGKNLLVLSLGRADGWKMDYSLFSGGQYFENLKFLYSFDRAYKRGAAENGGEKTKLLRLYIAEVKDYAAALEKAAELKKLPAAYYEKSYVKLGEKLKIGIYGDCDYVKIGAFKKGARGEKILVKTGENGEKYAEIQPKKYGLWSVFPYKTGKKGLNCTFFAYENTQNLYKKSVFSVKNSDLATGDGNLCEWKCHVAAILRYMQKYGKSPALVKKIKPELDLITTRNESEAKARQTIFYKARAGYPAYHVFDSTRIQEQFFGVTILLDAYKLFGTKKYLTYAVKTLECALKHYQKIDGRIETRFESTPKNESEDYTTVCCPLIPVVEVAAYLKEIQPEKSAYFYACAEKMAEYVYNRGVLFPTETDWQTLAEPFVEEGSISCSALTLLYYCARVKRVEKYVTRAKEFLDIHDNWEIRAHIAPMYYSSLRWWETKWEGDKDGNALCCGHAWTIWRAEADYRYYEVTGDKAYLERAKNGFMSNFSKIAANGQSYACYQPDYITGGGFTTRGEDVNFKVVRDFPKQTDSGLSRYVWIRYADGINLE